MSKRKSNAVRKEVPAEVPTELNEFVSAEDQVEVGESEQAPESQATDQGKMVGDVNPIVTAGRSHEQLFKDHKNKSGVIRALHAEGFQTKHICKFLNIRYQHVRNVLTQPLKRQAPAVETPAQPATE